MAISEKLDLLVGIKEEQRDFLDLPETLPWAEYRARMVKRSDYEELLSALDDFVTTEDFEPVAQAALNSITKGTLGKINGQSLEDGDVDIDMTLYKIVPSLPTEQILSNKIYLVPQVDAKTGKIQFNQYIYVEEEEKWQPLGPINADIDLSGYLKKVDADRYYVKKSTNQNASIATDNKGALANFSDNGQAYLAVRPKTAKYLMDIPYAGASFGVKDDGTAAFAHKQYSTYNKDTGEYSGAKNTAVLQFAGPVGLRYAKNTSTSSDVSEEMYKYIGVIDSPDEFQRVYSAKQVDDLLKEYKDEIAKLKQAIIDLGGNIQ